jgi:DNA-binding CsgD family transcriptional regulator
MSEIAVLLNDTTCRLLTLVGQGGIGKTRLAIEVAVRNQNAFPNGVFFVPLQPLTSPEDIVSTVATSVGYQFQLIGMAEVLLRTHQRERGMEMLALVWHHPASNQEMKDQAEQLAVQHTGRVTPDVYAAIWEQGKPRDLDSVVQELRVEFQVIKQLRGTPEVVEDDQVVDSNQFLANPLTSHELQILRLVAAGLANQAIARQMVITHGTVRGHLNKLYHKLDAENRVQAIIRARKLGLL